MVAINISHKYECPTYNTVATVVILTSEQIICIIFNTQVTPVYYIGGDTGPIH